MRGFIVSLTLPIISLEFEYDCYEALFQCVFDDTFEGNHFKLVICFVTKKFIGYFWQVLPIENTSKLYLGHPRWREVAAWLLENIEIS